MCDTPNPVPSQKIRGQLENIRLLGKAMSDRKIVIK